MGNEELHEWSRHYDTMLWTVTGIFSMANSSLIVYAYGHQSPAWPVYVLGIILTLLTVYFAASFRSARRFLNDKLPKDEKEITRGSPELKQWGVFFCLFSLFLLFWIALLIKNARDFAILWAGMGILIEAIMCYVAFHIGKSAQRIRIDCESEANHDLIL